MCVPVCCTFGSVVSLADVCEDPVFLKIIWFLSSPFDSLEDSCFKTESLITYVDFHVCMLGEERGKGEREVEGEREERECVYDIFLFYQLKAICVFHFSLWIEC